jgi:glycosyltransferase involved in cell wall biosynthesis
MSARVQKKDASLCMGFERPMILGVDGEARQVVEEASVGLFVEPENPAAVAKAVMTLRRLKANGTLDAMGRAGQEYVARRSDRNVLARSLEAVLKAAVGRRY